MKLTLVTETFPPEINGVAMTLNQLCEGLCERGHQVSIVRPYQKADREPARGKPFPELLFPGMPIPGYWSMRIGFPLRGRLLKAWRASRPDLVHVATEGPLGWAALSAAQKLHLPIASSFHTNFHTYSQHYGVGFLTRPALAYLRWFHNRTRITLSPTPELNTQLAADGFKNIRLLSRGVNTALYSPAKRDNALRASWGAGPGDLVLIHVSRIAAEKNFPLLLKAFEGIRRTHPSAKFIVTSDGPLRKKLAQRHPWIRFTGILPAKELARHYASADLFLYPSLTETFGNVVIEAMASGLAVVAFNYAAAKIYIRSRENGLTVPFGSAGAFLDASQQLASDRARCQILGHAARQTAELIPWKNVIDGFENDLATLLSPPTPFTKP